MGKIPNVVYADFETDGIESRPQYPPIPRGLAVEFPGKKGEYLTDPSQMKRALTAAYKNPDGVCFHHAKFDTDVAETHLGIAPPPWEKVHDTKHLIFLNNPHQSSLSLKPASEEILGIKPAERDRVQEWVIKNVPEAKRKPSQWGAYIARAPLNILAPYAIGDNTRTKKLFRHLYPLILKRDMLQSYQREQHLMPILLQNEREGIRVDLDGLQRDYAVYTKAINIVDEWLRKRLKSPALNVDSDEDFARALIKGKVVKENQFSLTKGGKLSVSKDNLTVDMFRDKQVFTAFNYRNKVRTCLSMFMLPWIEKASANAAHTIHTSWNQVRGEQGGARTGRMSSADPNYMNIPKNIGKNAEPPLFISADLPPVPLMRTYMLPDKGQRWGRRDCNQQELRLTAHFEDGDLCRRYNENPRFDLHQLVIDGVLELAGVTLDRGQGKIVNFQDIYGGGIPALCAKLGCSAEVAKQIKAAKKELCPDLEGLKKEIKKTCGRDEPIVTWGGREYYVEEPSYSERFKRFMTWEYKMLNYLIQGSAADFTKEIIIQYSEHPKREARLLTSVYDEFDISYPAKREKQEMKLLKDTIEEMRDYKGDLLGVPMLSDGESGTSWGTLQLYAD